MTTDQPPSGRPRRSQQRPPTRARTERPSSQRSRTARDGRAERRASAAQEQPASRRAEGSSRRSTPTSRRTWAERIALSLGVILTSLTVFAAVVLSWGLDKFEDIESVPIAPVEQAAAGEPANWLLVGTDVRDGIDPDSADAGVFVGGDPSELPSGKRTDTIIIARVDPENGRVDLLSVPRDLYVPIAGADRFDRVNAAFNAENGEERLVNTIEDYFGFDINHYAEINFVGFQDVVDELGGVPMWFDQPMRDANSGLNIEFAGCHRLDGFQALAFARGRNVQFFEDGEWRTDGTADLGRISRQQYFLRRVVDTAAAQVNLTSIGTINSLLSVGGQNLVIDSGVEPGDLLGLAQTFSNLRGDQIVTHSLPVADFRTSDGKAVLQMDQVAATDVVDVFRGLGPTPDAAATTTTTIPPVYEVSVFNGSGTAGQAGEVSSFLGDEGFTMLEPGNAAQRAQTVLRYAPGNEAGAIAVASRLLADPVFEVDPNVETIVLITGGDFAGTTATVRAPESVVLPTTAPPTTAPPEPAASDTSIIGVVPGPSPEGTDCI